MDRLFILQFAFKNLFSHRLRTYLTLIGIVIGISAIVFLVSFAFGIEKLVTSEITGGGAFRLVDVGTGNSQVVRLDEAAISGIKGLSEAKSVETTLNLAGKAKEGDATMDVAFFAASPQYVEWSGFRPRSGKVYESESDNQIMVNSAYLDFLKINSPSDAIGKKVVFNVIIPKELLEQEESIAL